jgi:hypothetical protein
MNNLISEQKKKDAKKERIDMVMKKLREADNNRKYWDERVNFYSELIHKLLYETI